jgi:protein SCO1
MVRILKILYLFLILLIPVVIYLFLQAFGRNHYDLEIFYQDGVGSSNFNQCDFGPGQHYIPNFGLTNHKNEVVSLDTYQNQLKVVDFFFTSCPTICPRMSNELTRVQNAYKNDDRVKILSFTVDPTYDSPEVLDEYASRYEVNPNRWHMITGEKEEIYQLARCGFLLPVEDGDGSPDDFIHSPMFVLVDKEQRIRGYYNGTQREEVDRLILEINVLLSQF